MKNWVRWWVNEEETKIDFVGFVLELRVMNILERIAFFILAGAVFAFLLLLIALVVALVGLFLLGLAGVLLILSVPIIIIAALTAIQEYEKDKRN